MTQQREYDRVPMLGQLVGEIMVFEPMAVTQLSVKGLAVDTRFPLHLNSLHEMRLTLGALPVVVKARVVKHGGRASLAGPSDALLDRALERARARRVTSAVAYLGAPPPLQRAGTAT